MCLAIYQPYGDKPIGKTIFDSAWSNNHDGGGYMFSHKKKLIVRKPFFKLKEMREAYEKDHTEFGVNSNFAIHFRFSTHGKKDDICTHPHIICDGQVGLMHNGILDFDPPGHDISDTVYFCRTVLVERDAKQVMSKEFCALLAEMIGPMNKFILMNNIGNVMIVNGKSGKWVDSESAVKEHKRWFSNENYLNAGFTRTGAHNKVSKWKWLEQYNKGKGYRTCQSYDGYSEEYTHGYPKYVKPTIYGAIDATPKGEPLPEIVQGEIVSDGQLVPSTDLSIPLHKDARPGDYAKLPNVYKDIAAIDAADKAAHLSEQQEIENLFKEASERDEWDKLSEDEWKAQQAVRHLEQQLDDAIAEENIALATDLSLELALLERPLISD